MLDILRMDLVRMRKMKTLWILPLIVIVILFITAYATHKTYSYATNVQELADSLDVELEGADSATLKSLLESMGGSTVNPLREYASAVSANILPLFLVIFVVLFANADFSSGFIKTIGGQIKRRSMLLWSKLISLFLYEILFFAVTFAGHVISEAIFFDKLNFANGPDFMRFMCVQFVMYYAVICFSVMVTTVSHSNMLGMVISLINVLGFFSVIALLLQNAIRAAFEKTVDLRHYLIMDNITEVRFHTTDVTKPLIVCGVTAVITIALSMLSLEKRDIV